jgi:CRP/FNR family transcriptional regulator, cyclic AMP receptor protein
MSELHNGLETLPLLEVEPELRAYLDPDERQLVARVAIPVAVFSDRELDIDGFLDDAGAFGAVILDGILLHRMSIGDQPALRLLGPGDMLSRSGGIRTGLLGESTHRASGPLRLAMLDDRVLLAARRFPRLFAGLQIRLGEQHQRLAAQLVICQLPRVEDRLLALMWLLAETWGRVTASGTVLPIALTHDALGELIGARRPTVTLALKELADRGSLFRQDGEWLLLEPPPQGVAPGAVGAEPKIAFSPPTGWAVMPDDAESERGTAQRDHEPTTRELTVMISALREMHVRTSGEVRARLEQARRTRERTESLRQQIARQRQQLSPRAPLPARRPAP